MKIVMCNSFYYYRGGLERYMFELSKLLEANGHEIIPFCMTHERNLPTEYSRYFVSHIDYAALNRGKLSMSATLQVGERLFYSSEARQKLKQLILDTKPDIFHVQGLGHEMSASILDVVRSSHVPVVQTLHDFGLMCPNASFATADGVCVRCMGHRYYNVVLRRCKRSSLGASLLACVSQYEHMLTNVYGRNVDVYISPSRFLQQKLLEDGVRTPIVVIPNFVAPPEGRLRQDGSGYCIFFSRLLAIKGARTLIEAAKFCPGAQIYIAGEGDLEDELRKMIAQYQLDNVRLLGYVEPARLTELISSANFTVLPSENYENYPMVIVESFACGKAVVASNLGAIPDLVIHGRNGLLFEPGNARQLADHINHMFAHPEQAAAMGENAWASYMSNNHPEPHYRKIMEVYGGLLARSARAV